MAAFTRVNPGDPMQAHQLNQVIDALDGAVGAGVPIAVTAVNDATNYALAIQNDDATNSRALLVQKQDGTTLIQADINGVVLALANGSVHNAALASDVARANLLTNSGFEIWQRAVSFAPVGTTTYTADRWVASLGGTSAFPVCGQDATNNDTNSKYCLAFSYTHNAESFCYQKIEDGYQLRGQPVTFSIRVKCNTANAVRPFIQVQPGGTNTYGAYHVGNAAYATLTVTLTLPTNITYILVGVSFMATTTATYLDNAMLVVGSQAADYVPLHPADDLARCLRYYEILGGDANLDIYIAPNATGASQNLGAPLSFAAKKPILPTLTKVGTWGVNNCAQPSAGGGRSTVQLLAVSVAAGLMTFNTTGTSTYITAEANP